MEKEMVISNIQFIVLKKNIIDRTRISDIIDELNISVDEFDKLREDAFSKLYSYYNSLYPDGGFLAPRKKEAVDLFYQGNSFHKIAKILDIRVERARQLVCHSQRSMFIQYYQDEIAREKPCENLYLNYLEDLNAVKEGKAND